MFSAVNKGYPAFESMLSQYKSIDRLISNKEVIEPTSTDYGGIKFDLSYNLDKETFKLILNFQDLVDFYVGDVEYKNLHITQAQQVLHIFDEKAVFNFPLVSEEE